MTIKINNILKSETFQLQILNGNSPIVYYACIENCQANSKLGKVGEFRQAKLNFFLWKKKFGKKFGLLLIL